MTLFSKKISQKQAISGFKQWNKMCRVKGVTLSKVFKNILKFSFCLKLKVINHLSFFLNISCLGELRFYIYLNLIPQCCLVIPGNLCLRTFCYLHSQFRSSVMSDSFRRHGLQHTRLPCPSPIPRACSNSCPLSRWCHPTISSSVIPFSSCPQFFSSSGSFQMSQLFSSGGQNLAKMGINNWLQTTIGPSEVHTGESEGGRACLSS